MNDCAGTIRRVGLAAFTPAQEVYGGQDNLRTSLRSFFFRRGLLNWKTIPGLLTNICKDCAYMAIGDCKQGNCLIRFARRTQAFGSNQGILDVPGASKLIPANDYKAYYPEAVARVMTKGPILVGKRPSHLDDVQIISATQREMAPLLAVASFIRSRYSFQTRKVEGINALDLPVRTTARGNERGKAPA